MRKVDGHARTVSELLEGKKYSIDYYQREYRWAAKQVTELIHDLTSKFSEHFEEGDAPDEVKNYGHYFLGSIIISERDQQKFIVDGQQRLTTLTLILIFLNNLQKEKPTADRSELDRLIYSEQYRKKSFNIDVEERQECMDALFNGKEFDDSEQPESVQNIVARYDTIETQFPSDLTNSPLPYFIDWLKENVHFVEITAYSDEDAYTIFETMNDRGLSLTPTEMLKGYLLANIKNIDQRTQANDLWKKRIAVLREIGKDEDADCIKAWLRSQYANSIRERKRGATPQDWDQLGTEFHRWVKGHEADIGLEKSNDYFEFITEEFDFFSRQYIKARNAAETLTEGLEHIFYNAQSGFTLQYQLLLAPLKMDDDEETIQKKMRIVAQYIDILITRRNWNFKSNSYSAMQYAMFLVMKALRGKEIDEVSDHLIGQLDKEDYNFETNDRFYLHQQNRKHIHKILARITDYIETRSDMPSRYLEYVTGRGQQRYEVEHIWADKYERHRDEFDHQADFNDYRNRIGDLVLLPRSFNESYGAMEYGDKLEHYNSQNILARSLHPKCYENNPGFLKFIKESGLPFESYAEFKKAGIDKRQALYKTMAERIWNVSQLKDEVAD